MMAWRPLRDFPVRGEINAVGSRELHEDTGL